MLQSIFYFIMAGLCEIGGGYLIWLYVKDDKSLFYFLAGSLVLIAYGIIPTLQTANFGKVYAAYGGIFYRFINSMGLGNRRYHAR